MQPWFGATKIHAQTLTHVAREQTIGTESRLGWAGAPTRDALSRTLGHRSGGWRYSVAPRSYGSPPCARGLASRGEWLRGSTRAYDRQPRHQQRQKQGVCVDVQGTNTRIVLGTNTRIGTTHFAGPSCTHCYRCDIEI